MTGRDSFDHQREHNPSATPPHFWLITLGSAHSSLWVNSLFQPPNACSVTPISTPPGDASPFKAPAVEDVLPRPLYLEHCPRSHLNRSQSPLPCAIAYPEQMHSALEPFLGEFPNPLQSSSFALDRSSQPCEANCSRRSPRADLPTVLVSLYTPTAGHCSFKPPLIMLQYWLGADGGQVRITRHSRSVASPTERYARSRTY